MAAIIDTTPAPVIVAPLTIATPAHKTIDDNHKPSTLIGSYRLDKTIGQGTYGKVKLGVDVRTGDKVAVKIIEKAQIQSAKQVARLQREIRFLKLLHHPNIVRVLDVIETVDFIYIVMEYAAGGELFDYIVAHKRVKEREARTFFRMVLSAVDYCHKNAVIHRDLKPENLLLDESKSIKIIDFGFGNNFASDKLLDTFCGSPFYAAPEMILGKKYEGPEVDMWSLGVILFALLCGHLPFDDDNMKELYKKIATGSYTCPDYLMPTARHLISRLITVDPKQRATLPEVLNHPWVNEMHSGPPPNHLPARPKSLRSSELSSDIVNRLMAFGYQLPDIEAAFNAEDWDESRPDAIRATYFLLAEMLDREEARLAQHLELPERALDAGRAQVRSLDGLDSAIMMESGGLGAGGGIDPRLVGSMGVVVIGRDANMSHSGSVVQPPPPIASTQVSSRLLARTSLGGGVGGRSAKSAGSPRRPNIVSHHQSQPTLQTTVSNEDGDIGMQLSSPPTPARPSTTSPTRPSQILAVSRSRANNQMRYYTPLQSSTQPSKNDDVNDITSRLRTVSLWFLNSTTTSSKPPPTIIREIIRTLSSSPGVTFHHESGSFVVTCEVDVNSFFGTPSTDDSLLSSTLTLTGGGGSIVSFQIEVCRIPRMSNLYGLQFRRVAGGVWNYKKVCSRLTTLFPL